MARGRRNASSESERRLKDRVKERGEDWSKLPLSRSVAHSWSARKAKTCGVRLRRNNEREKGSDERKKERKKEIPADGWTGEGPSGAGARASSGVSEGKMERERERKEKMTKEPPAAQCKVHLFVMDSRILRGKRPFDTGFRGP